MYPTFSTLQTFRTLFVVRRTLVWTPTRNDAIMNGWYTILEWTDHIYYSTRSLSTSLLSSLFVHFRNTFSNMAGAWWCDVVLYVVKCLCVCKPKEGGRKLDSRPPKWWCQSEHAQRVICSVKCTCHTHPWWALAGTTHAMRMSMMRVYGRQTLWSERSNSIQQ